MKSYFNRSIGLSIVRVLLGFFVIKNAIFYLPMAEELFGGRAITPYNSYVFAMESYNLSWLTFPFEIPGAPQLFLIAMIAVAMAFVLGVGRALVGGILFLMVMVLRLRNGYILDGSDNVMQVIFPFIVLANSYDHFGIDSRLNDRVNSWFQPSSDNGKLLLRRCQVLLAVAVMVQVCYVYFFTATAKAQGELWTNGTATYYTMRVDEFRATEWNLLLTENHYFVVLSTYFTLIFEIAFPFLVWFKRSKWGVLAAGVALHMGIWVFMRIDNFSFVMMSTYFLFVTDAEYKTFFSFFTNRLTVLYDNACVKCIRFRKVVEFVDIFGTVRFESLRDPQVQQVHGDRVDMDVAHERMASFWTRADGSKNTLYGWSSLRRITQVVPLLWPAYTFMWIAERTGIGARFYQRIAIDRQLLSCTDSCVLVGEAEVVNARDHE